MQTQTKMIYLSLTHNPNTPCMIHYSNRRTINIIVKKDASIHVRAPFYIRQKQLEAFISEHLSWISEKYMETLVQIEKTPQIEVTPQMERNIHQLEKRFRAAAKVYFPKRCEELSMLTGTHYTKITIRDQKTRWGSCSQTGTLSFNYRLMMADSSVIDYVIIHELCHLAHMDHSKAFWNMVSFVMPDYKEKQNWLKAHGDELTELHYLLSLM